MKELDELLSRYARERYQAAPAAERSAFETLLTLPDPQIADYLLGYRKAPDAGLAALVVTLVTRA